MFRALFAALLIGGGLFYAAAARADADSPFGSWLTADQSGVIAIEPCGADICGRIAGVDLNNPGSEQPRDWRGQPECGDVFIVATASPRNADQWFGTITDPRNGNVWHARLTLRDGTLYLRGYVGLPLFGQTQAWTPYTGQIRTGCRVTAE